MPKDEFHIHAVTPNGGFAGIRKTDTEESEILFTPVTQGQSLPPGAEVVSLKPRVGTSIADVETVYKVKGPPKISTQKYRENWDVIYGQKDSKALN